MDIERYPELREFFSLRFHEDWFIVHKSDTNAVASYVSKYPKRIPELLAELDALLAEGLDDEQLDRVLYKMGANIYTPGLGKTPESWVSWVRDEVRRLVASR